MLYLAVALWPLGDVERAVSLVRSAEARLGGVAHIATRAYGHMHATMFELMRGDLAPAAPHIVELERVAREQDLALWGAIGVFLDGLARTEGGVRSEGLAAMRRGIELLRGQNVTIFDGLLKIALAEAVLRTGDPEGALAILDETLATSDRAGSRAFEAELHRVRGEALLKRDPVNPAIAEEAFQTAIAIARKQGTRSFGLRAALALAKLYQSTSRPVEAHAILAPALEGFSPTREMPEIAEAMSLSARLA
jgi:predicted ATPase